MLRVLPKLMLAACAVGVASCGGGGGGGTPPIGTPSSAPSSAPTNTPTPAPTSTPTPTPTPSGPTPTPSPAPNTQPIAVANQGGNVLIFAPTSKGNVAPQSTIAGSNTMLSAPAALALRSSGTVYTINAGGNQVLVFTGSGNVAPVQTITDTAVGIASDGIALATSPAFALYVSSQANGEIDVFTNSNANGPTAPNAVIPSNATTTLSRPTSMTADHAGNLYVIDGSAIKIFANAAAGGTIAPTIISGGVTTLSAPAGIAIDGRGDILVTDGASVKVFAAGSSGNIAPTATISGAATGLQNATGVSVDGTGAIWVCDGGANALFRFRAGANGNVAPITAISGGNTTLNNPAAIQLQPVI